MIVYDSLVVHFGLFLPRSLGWVGQDSGPSKYQLHVDAFVIFNACFLSESEVHLTCFC